MTCSANCLVVTLVQSAVLWTGCHGLSARPASWQQLDESQVKLTMSDVTSRSEAILQWEAYTTDLWATLVLRNSPKVYDFEESDNATRKQFIARCNLTFGIEIRDAVPDEVVHTMCSKAGGRAEECTGLVTSLWKAYENSTVELWCADTYKWFADRTLPKCSTKCTSLFCKDRCSLASKWQDLQDQAAAFEIRYKQHKNAFDRIMANSGLKEMKSKLDEYNTSKCIPAAENVSELVALENKTNFTWQGLQSKLPALANEREEAYKGTKAARTNQSESPELAQAVKSKQEAIEEAAKLKRKASSVFTRLVDLKSKLKEVSSELEVGNSKVKNLTAKYNASEAAIWKEVDLLEANKTLLSSAVKAIKDFNKTTCAPAVEEAAMAAEKNGNLIQKQRYLEEDLSQAKKQVAKAKDVYEAELKKLKDAQELAAAKMKKADDQEEAQNKTNEMATELIAEIAQFESSVVRPLEDEVKVNAEGLKTALDLQSSAQGAEVKAQSSMKKVAKDLDAAKELSKWDNSSEAEAHLKGCQDNYTTTEKELSDAKDLLAVSTKDVQKLQAELAELRDKMFATLRALEGKRNTMASKQKEAQKIGMKIVDLLADSNEAEGMAANLTNSSEEKLALVNQSQELVGNVTESLANNSATQAEQKDYEKKADRALEALERLVNKRHDYQLQVQGFEAALNRSMDAVNHTQGKIEATKEKCKSMQGEVENLTETENSTSIELMGFVPKVSEADEKVVNTTAAVEFVEKELDLAVTVAQKNYDNVTEAYSDASKKAKEMRDDLLVAQGKLTKAQGMLEFYDKTFKGMTDEFLAKENATGIELDKINATLSNVTGELQRIRDEQKPMEAALGNMLKK